MAVLTAPIIGGTIHGTSANDVITGSAKDNMLSHMTDTAAGLVFQVNAGTDSIMLAGIHLPQINTDDFLFV